MSTWRGTFWFDSVSGQKKSRPAVFEDDALLGDLSYQRALRQGRVLAVLIHINENKAVGRYSAVDVDIDVQVRQVQGPGNLHIIKS